MTYWRMLLNKKIYSLIKQRLHEDYKLRGVKRIKTYALIMLYNDYFYYITTD